MLRRFQLLITVVATVRSTSSFCEEFANLFVYFIRHMTFLEVCYRLSPG